MRSEYGVQANDAPYDMIFSPWDRDVAFWDFYSKNKGRIDSIAGVNLWASSPTNRPHACDGKITTSEMAEQLVFLAHYGKVTLREKFPEKGSRRMPDLPGAIPHLSLGYSTPSPIFVGDRLRAAREVQPPATAAAAPAKADLAEVADRLKGEKRRLWRGSVLPAADADGWLVSGAVAYRRMLEGAPDDPDKASAYWRDQLAELANRYLYTVSREGDVVPAQAKQVYDRFGHYRIPRVKGTFALHQLRLLLGNDLFLKVMDDATARFAGKPMSAAQFIAAAEQSSGRELAPFLKQWSERAGIPDPRPSVAARKTDAGWTVALDVAQAGQPYRLLSSLAIEAGGQADRQTDRDRRSGHTRRGRRRRQADPRRLQPGQRRPRAPRPLLHLVATSSTTGRRRSSSTAPRARSRPTTRWRCAGRPRSPTPSPRRCRRWCRTPR